MEAHVGVGHEPSERSRAHGLRQRLRAQVRGADRVRVVDDGGAAGLIAADRHREPEREQEPDHAEQRRPQRGERLAQLLGAVALRPPDGDADQGRAEHHREEHQGEQEAAEPEEEDGLHAHEASARACVSHHPNRTTRRALDPACIPAPMSFVWSTLIVVLVSGLAAGTLLLVRRRAPAGSVFEDGDRASGVFGVIATGFSVLLGLIVFLAFASYDQSRTGAESEARLIVQQYETTQSMPIAVRGELGGELVCYARSVVHQEWPQMGSGKAIEGFNTWGGAIFRTLRRVNARTFTEQTAYDKYLDRMADREQARADRTHGADGVIPESLWITLFCIAVVIFGFVLFFADSGERWYAQAALMFSVISVIVATMLLIHSLNDPVHAGFGGLKPVAMQRTLRVLAKDRAFVGDHSPVPCDARGVAKRPSG